MQNRRLPTARLTRRHPSLALAATACIGVGIFAAQAGATPGITGNENEFWAIANPVPTYRAHRPPTLSAASPGRWTPAPRRT